MEANVTPSMVYYGLTKKGYELAEVIDKIITTVLRWDEKNK